jgi:hypothetical protein
MVLSRCNLLLKIRKIVSCTSSQGFKFKGIEESKDGLSLIGSSIWVVF